jgi:hypothetical protein
VKPSAKNHSRRTLGSKAKAASVFLFLQRQQVSHHVGNLLVVENDVHGQHGAGS